MQRHLFPQVWCGADGHYSNKPFGALFNSANTVLKNATLLLSSKRLCIWALRPFSPVQTALLFINLELHASLFALYFLIDFFQ